MQVPGVSYLTLLQQNKFMRLGTSRLQRILRGFTYTYKLPVKGSAEQLLVTVESGPLILDGKLYLYFREFGVVKKVLWQSHTFNHQIDSGLRSIIFFLNEYVEAGNIPGFMTTSNSIRRKLFFQGEVFLLRQMP